DRKVTGVQTCPLPISMTRGTLLEPEARRIYAEQTGRDVDEVGFARLDTDTYTLGSSPDGLVGETGGIEIKSPSAKVHVATVLSEIGRASCRYRSYITA